MKKLSFTCLGILLSVCTSCSNSDEEEKDWTGQPSVTISDPVGEKDISITITPENAVAAAYTCIAEGGGSKPTAEEVLEKGIQIDATQPSTIVIDWLDYDTDYVVIAAVRSKEGTVASDTAEITTAKDPAIDLGQGANRPEPILSLPKRSTELRSTELLRRTGSGRRRRMKTTRNRNYLTMSHMPVERSALRRPENGAMP